MKIGVTPTEAFPESAWAAPYEQQGSIFWWIFEYVFRPLNSTMFALLAQSSGAEAEEAFEAFLSLHDRGAIELGIDAERHESVDQALHRYRELRGDPSRVIALGRRAELATEREQMQSEIVRRVPEVELEGELGEFVSLLEEPNDDMRGVLREGALLALQLRQLLYSMELA